jgi:hypothetical protein
MLTALVIVDAIGVLLLLLIAIFLKKINDNLRRQTEVLHARLDQIGGAVTGGFGHVATELSYGEMNESLKAIGAGISKLGLQGNSQSRGKDEA